MPRAKMLVRKLRRHRGEKMSPEMRSAFMARIKGKNTGPERLLREALSVNGLRCEYHAQDPLGRPDFVFRQCQLVVFVDGDFQRGWHFSLWRDKLTARWEQEIESNRRRDSWVPRSLRRAGGTCCAFGNTRSNGTLTRACVGFSRRYAKLSTSFAKRPLASFSRSYLV